MKGKRKDKPEKKLTRDEFLLTLQKVSGPKAQDLKPTSDEEKKETSESDRRDGCSGKHTRQCSVANNRNSPNDKPLRFHS